MKDAKKKKENKKRLKISDIKRYSRINIGHTIEKIKMYEREMTVITVAVMIIIILLVVLIIGTSFNKIDEYNIYEENDLVVKYSKYEEGYSDVVTLDKDDVVDDNDGLNKDSHDFRIYNKSDDSMKVNILLQVDEEIIELEDCYKLLVNDNAIKYSFDNKNINDLYDSKDGEKYVLEEDFIDPGKYKDYKLDIWINDEEILDTRNNHFHGKLIVKQTKKY